MVGGGRGGDEHTVPHIRTTGCHLTNTAPTRRTNYTPSRPPPPRLASTTAQTLNMNGASGGPDGGRCLHAPSEHARWHRPSARPTHDDLHAWAPPDTWHRVARQSSASPQYHPQPQSEPNNSTLTENRKPAPPNSTAPKGAEAGQTIKVLHAVRTDLSVEAGVRATSLCLPPPSCTRREGRASKGAAATPRAVSTGALRSPRGGGEKGDDSAPPSHCRRLTNMSSRILDHGNWGQNCTDGVAVLGQGHAGAGRGRRGRGAQSYAGQSLDPNKQKPLHVIDDPGLILHFTNNQQLAVGVW